VFCKTGRPEIANDIMGVQQTDVWVMLRARRLCRPEDVSRDELVERMSEALSAAVPGANFGFSQPIEMRRRRARRRAWSPDVAVLLYGDDLDTLGSLGKQIERLLPPAFPGRSTCGPTGRPNVPTTRIDARPDQLARHAYRRHRGDADGVGDGRDPGRRDLRGPAPLPAGAEVSPASGGERRSGAADPGRRPPAAGPCLSANSPTSVRRGDPPSMEHENSPATDLRLGQRPWPRRSRLRCRGPGGGRSSQVHLPAGYSIAWGGDFENLALGRTQAAPASRPSSSA
jgi:cobalt-zinc-cadmium resistance protein CzcA